MKKVKNNTYCKFRTIDKDKSVERLRRKAAGLRHFNAMIAGPPKCCI